MELVGIIVPLNDMAVVAVMSQEDGRVIYKFLKEKLGLSHEVAEKLVRPIKAGRNIYINR